MSEGIIEATAATWENGGCKFKRFDIGRLLGSMVWSLPNHRTHG